MGIEYEAAIMVGLPRGEIHNQELIYDDELEVCSPCYDGGSDDGAVAGFFYEQSGTYSASLLEWDQQKIDELKTKFKDLTGQEAKVWLSPYGW